MTVLLESQYGKKRLDKWFHRKPLAGLKNIYGEIRSNSTDSQLTQ